MKSNSFRSLNLQTHIKRFLQSQQTEALDHFTAIGEQHFNDLVSQYVEHDHTERPHPAMGIVPLSSQSLSMSAATDGMFEYYKRLAK